MRSCELFSWGRYFEKRPPDYQIIGQLLAFQNCLIHSLLAGFSKDKVKPLTVEDQLPWFGKTEDEKMSLAEELDYLREQMAGGSDDGQ